MNKTSLLLLLGLGLLLSCGSGRKNIPNISSVQIDLKLQRFDRDFFAIDTSNTIAELQQMERKYPHFLSLFLNNILGLPPEQTVVGVNEFIQQMQAERNAIEKTFPNTDHLKKELELAFRYLKYYYPNYIIPRIITIAGPYSLAETSTGLAPNFLGNDFLGISLQFYLGKDFERYQEGFFIETVAPQYRSRRFSKEYIIADAMQLIVDDLFPDNSKGKPLIEQMIQRGKQWWLLDKFLPQVADSVKTGYTQHQLDWCLQFEGNIWASIVQNDELYSINPSTLQTYIGESPFTQGLSQEYSPGNLGQWIGWQIVKKYVDKNSSLTIDEVMKASPTAILDGAAYKPK